LVQLAGAGRVLRRDAIDAHLRAARGQDSLRVVNVLERERDAVQGAAVVAARDLALGPLRLRARELGSHGDERVELRLEGLDALEAGRRELDRGELAGADEAGGLGDGEAAEVLRHEGSNAVGDGSSLLV